jgi:glycosyltransferase involved in cell wall biosynthesis
VNPELSLILPAYNEQARLPYTLGEIESYVCREQVDCEVIVVDNGSRDATSAVVQQAMRSFPTLRLLRTDRRARAAPYAQACSPGADVLFGDADLSWSVDELSRSPGQRGVAGRHRLTRRPRRPTPG